MKPLWSIVAVFALSAGTTTAREEPDAARAEDQARALALRVHRQAAAIDKVPRFYYQARSRVSEIDTMRHLEDRSLELLKTALDEPLRAEDLNNAQTFVFAWTEKHFLYEQRLLRAGVADSSSETHLFWTRSQAWRRDQDVDEPATFTIDNTAKEIWEDFHLPAPGYIQVTPHELWWGDTKHRGQTISLVPPEAASYRHVETEQFGGEMCDVVESAGRPERLWIGRKSGRLRGVLRYIYQGPRELSFYETEAARRIAGRTFSSEKEFEQWVQQSFGELSAAERAELQVAWNEMYFESNARLRNLIRFDDYHEVARGVWIPLREVSSSWSSEPQGKYHYVRGELVVEEVKTDVDLSETIAALLPEEGERIRDLRFAVPVRYDYRADRTREEILKLVSDRQQEIAASAQRLKQFTRPVGAMVGRPAPELPGEGWIGGERPKLEGTPHLIHFWATWCGPCKGDLPLLKKLAAGGATVIGIHPPGTLPEGVKKQITEEELGYPTLLVSSEGDAEDLAGYPVKLYPYCVLVDSQGHVAAHGVLGSELLGQFGDLRKDAEAKSVK